MIKNKVVLELGSRNVNGSLANHILSLKPKTYEGVDYVEGNNVHRILDLVDLLKVYEENSIDVIITTELMEHVEDWRTVINNMKKILKIGGVLFLTTRSKGFPLHSFPYDYWRYELIDIEYIFSDMEKIDLRPDPLKSHPGVFIIARKIEETGTVDLNKLELFHI